ncbi:hypothetical protein ANCDUO_03700 [Ancylostoma duodenale]|uniref:Uncharacterized protein n=1 Tax=Ancylostoma duodenale TaxID=51022 RepID=A0A0C2GWS8_9BILA|nr:hypothetical protein ANCDUO_03700 [Ancylostoma duodenale]
MPLPRTKEERDGTPLEIPINDLDNGMESGELIIMGRKVDVKNVEGSAYCCATITNDEEATITLVNCFAPNSVASEGDKGNFYSNS